MPNYIPPPKDPSYLQRKLYTQNKIRISNDTNPMGQYNIEIVNVDQNERITIKQYQLFPDQLKVLIEKNNNNSNPSLIEFVNSNSNYSSLGSDVQENMPVYSNKVHPEYSNKNNPSHFDSYKKTMNVKNNTNDNNNFINGNSNFRNSDDNIEGFSDMDNTYGSFNFSPPENNNINNVCNRNTG